MGLIKKIADYEGTLHEVHIDAVFDMVNNVKTSLRTLLAGKAASVHTHAAITDGTASVSAVNDRGSHIIRINATGVDGTAVDADHAVEDSDNLITSGAVYSDLAGKAPISNPDFTGRVYCQSGHFNEVYGDNDNGIKITPDIDSDYGVFLENDGAVTIDGESVSGTAVDSTPTANSNKLVKSSGVATALAGKAASVHTHAQSDVTGLTAALNSKANVDDAQFTGQLSLNSGNDGFITSVEETGHHGLCAYSDDGAMKSKIELDSNGTIRAEVLDEDEEYYIGLSLTNSSFECSVDTIFSSDVSFESGLSSGDSVEVNGDLSADSFSGDGVESTPTLTHTNKIVSSHGIANALYGKVDANVDDTYDSVDTDHKINVANLVNGKMYRAYAADAFDGIAIRDMFNHPGSTVSFNNWVDDSTNVFMLLFRYYKLSTSIEGRYTHVIDIIKYDVPTGPM